MERNKPSKAAKASSLILADVVCKELGTDRCMREPARRLVKYFVERYETQFNDILPLNRARATLYLKRVLLWCHDSEQEARDIIDFLFDKWPAIKNQLQIVGRPSVSILGSASFFHQIYALKHDGFKRSVKSRFIEDESPSEGWG